MSTKSRPAHQNDLPSAASREPRKRHWNPVAAKEDYHRNLISHAPHPFVLRGLDGAVPLVSAPELIVENLQCDS